MSSVGVARVGAVLREAAARLHAARIATARPDAALLLARALATTRLSLFTGPERPLSARELAGFEALVTRRLAQEPIQYILGETEFCGLTIAVGPGVFIPRPETEALVLRAAALAAERPAVALELGAGSGAVACALAVRCPRLVVWAVERAPAALAWARENVRRLGLADRVVLLEGDLFDPLAGRGLEGRCDAVVANPPYVAREALAALPEEVRAWEPRVALDGGPDGLALVARILDGATPFLAPAGRLLLEIGEDQGVRLRARLAEDPRWAEPVIYRDFMERERVLEVRGR